MCRAVGEMRGVTGVPPQAWPACGSRAPLRCALPQAHARSYCGHRPGRGAKAGESVPGWVAWEGTVPLSEHEQRQLEQIEQALRTDDPRFADAVHAADPRVHYQRRVIAAALGFVIGAGLLLAH